MQPYHPLLRRQLRRAGALSDVAPSLEEWRRFVEEIERTYLAVDQDRYTIERSFAICSQELRELYDGLKQSTATELQSERDKQRLHLAVHKATFEASTDGIIVVDQQRRIASFNRRYCELWRIPNDMAERCDRDEILTFVLAQLQNPGEHAAQIDAIYDDPKGISSDLSHCIDGRVFERKSAPVLLDGHIPYGRVWFMRDISQEWHREQQLLATTEAAEEASRAKSDFLANMSHELRTPLNAILGFSRVLERAAGPLLSEKHRRYLEYITQSGEHMLQLVNDLLDLRVLEQRELQLEPIDLTTVAREAVDVVEALALQRKLQVVVAVPTGMPLVRGERRAIMQILINLLSNAIKFTPEGGTVTVGAAQHGKRIKLMVQDNGVGIARADQRRLFTYFEQLGAKQQHDMKGSGIGLALTKALVLKQGGSIEVRSAPGEGSTFEVALQVAS